MSALITLKEFEIIVDREDAKPIVEWIRLNIP
jgi:hypothetical protein